VKEVEEYRRAMLLGEFDRRVSREVWVAFSVLPDLDRRINV
jgi:hypothetical protein